MQCPCNLVPRCISLTLSRSFKCVDFCLLHFFFSPLCISENTRIKSSPIVLYYNNIVTYRNISHHIKRSLKCIILYCCLYYPSNTEKCVSEPRIRRPLYFFICARATYLSLSFPTLVFRNKHIYRLRHFQWCNKCDTQPGAQGKRDGIHDLRLLSHWP